MNSNQKAASTLRAPDLLKKIRHHNEGKYDFKKIPLLKGTRNKNLKGRPHAIAEVSPRKRKADEDYAVSHEPLHQISAIQEIDVDLVPSLNIEECYLNGIKEQGGLFSIDNIFHSFILMDFSEETKTVKNNKFVFLKRKVNNFEDVGCWVYSCSCEPARAELIACLDNNLDVSFDDFVLRHPWCHHIQVVKTILEEFDAVNGIFPSTFDNSSPEINEVDPSIEEVTKLSEKLFCVQSQKGPGVIEVTGAVKCLTCNSCKVHCLHLSKFLELHGSNDNDSIKTGSYQPKCYSTLRIPFVSTPTMQEVYKLSPVDRVSLVQQLVSKNEVPSRPIQCINCGVDLEGSEENYTTALLLTSGIVELEVSSRKCSKCKSLNPIDGIQACLINMGNYMVCHEILRKYLYYFLSGR